MAWLAAYNFDNVGSTTVIDATGNGHDIDLTGSAGVQAIGGRQGGRLGKTGAAMPVLPASLLAVAETDDRTIMFDALVAATTWWVRFEDDGLSSGLWGVLDTDGAGMRGQARRQSDGALAARPVAPPPEPVSPYRNYALTYVRATGVLSIYRDGALIATSGFAPGTQLMTGADRINIAEWSSTTPSIDNLRFADHAADAAEVAALAGQPVEAPPAPVEQASASLPVDFGLAAFATTPPATVSQATGDLPVALALAGAAIGEENEMAPSAVSDVLCSSWATVDDLSATQLTRLTDLGFDAAEINAALLRASELLWAFSGRQWMGPGCEEEADLRSYPPQAGTSTWPYSNSWGSCPCWSYGVWVDNRLYPGPGFYGRHIGRPVAVQLPRQNVTLVTSVLINGEPFVAWSLDAAGWLTRTDGQGWDVCGGETRVTYRFGDPPPAGGRDAAIELGIEILLDRSGSGECRLPPNTVSVTRQGLTMELMSTDRPEFRTALPLVDMWLEAVNPYRRPQAAQVWSPDVPHLTLRRGTTREI